jgi:spermidine synthase
MDQVHKHIWVIMGIIILMALVLGFMGFYHHGRILAGTAGFMGIAIEVAILIAAQSARGSVFKEMGLLLTAFMSGMALGSHTPGPFKSLLHHPRGPCITLALCAATGSSAALAIPLAITFPPWSLGILVPVLGMVGFTSGLAYPVAVSALSEGGIRAGSVAYAIDLFGSALGALLTSFVTLPLLGLHGTCAIVSVVALALSFGLLLRQRVS